MTVHLKSWPWPLLLGGFAGLIVLTLLLLFADFAGVPRALVNGFFLVLSIIGYAVIGMFCRTTRPDEYFVAGRRISAPFNGMATAADWMSAASFIGMAGTLYLSGYDGLAFVLGWTGGYCLVAIFLAPYLRKFGQFTIPDFLGERYGGNIPRLIGVIAAIVCSFNSSLPPFRNPT